MRTFPSIEPLMKKLSLTGLKLTHVTASEEKVTSHYLAKEKNTEEHNHRTNIIQIAYQPRQ